MTRFGMCCGSTVESFQPYNPPIGGVIRELLMKLTFRLFLAALALSTVGLRAQTPATGWVTLFDGANLNSFNVVGNANWKLADGIVEATSGSGFLVTKETYSNFEIRVEFWVDEGANSGVYMRCQDAAKITDMTCYEANIC